MSDDLVDRLRSGRTPQVNGRLITWEGQCREAAARIEALEAENTRLRAHIARMSAAGDAMDGWTSDKHDGADLARKNWASVSRAALAEKEPDQ